MSSSSVTSPVNGHTTPHCIDMMEAAMTFDGFARDELESFFRRREERGKFYCSTCLALQLARRGVRKVTAVAWAAAVDEAFINPGLLRVRSGRPCEVCKQPGLSIGAEPQEDEVGDALAVLIHSP
jgi:hypothetical protein